MNERDRRLRLHRETLRVLSAHALARVGGGASQVPAPKSNVWTGVPGADGGGTIDGLNQTCTSGHVSGN